jgi:hypothetical protein
MDSGSVRVDDVDADAPPTDRCDHLAKSLGRTATAADNGAEVLRVNPYLEALAPATVDHAHPDLVRVLDDALDQVLEDRA